MIKWIIKWEKYSKSLYKFQDIIKKIVETEAKSIPPNKNKCKTKANSNDISIPTHYDHLKLQNTMRSNRRYCKVISLSL